MFEAVDILENSLNILEGTQISSENKLWNQQI